MEKYLAKTLARIVVITIAVSGPTAQAADKQEFHAGTYDNALLAYDAVTNTITGFFAEKSEQDGRPSIRCEFYFAGKLIGATAKIKVYQLTLHDAPTSGTVKIEKAGKAAALNIQLDEEQPGCMNIYPKAELAKTSLALVAQANWIEIRMASGKKTYFYKNASSDAVTKTYITNGDVVGVLEYKNAWAKVSYIGERKTTTGWVRNADLFPAVAK